MFSFQSKLALDGSLYALAEFGAAVHGQSGLSAIEKNLQMGTLPENEGGALPLQPLLHLLGVHGLILNTSVA